MKDALGHGSNGKDGFGTFTPKAKPGYDPIAEANIARYQARQSGGVPMSSNAAAAQALMGVLRSTQAPLHQAFQRMPDLSAPNRGEVDKLKNGQLARGRAFRS